MRKWVLGSDAAAAAGGDDEDAAVARERICVRAQERRGARANIAGDGGGR